MKTIGIVAGSFDPITLGHQYVIDESLKLFDKTIVIVCNNRSKKHMFTNDERVELISKIYPNIDVDKLPNGSTLIEYSYNYHKATHILRGIRDVNDFTYEYNISNINERIVPEVKTVFIVPPKELSSISSSVVKELSRFSTWPLHYDKFVSKHIFNALKNKI